MSSTAPPAQENIIIAFNGPGHPAGVPRYLEEDAPDRRMENLRKLIFNIGYADPTSAEAEFIPRALRAELSSQRGGPPVRVLVVHMFSSFYNEEIRNIIDTWRPRSIMMTNICLVDQSKRWSEESVLTFHTNLASTDASHFITSVSCGMIDLLHNNGGINLDLLHSIQEKDHLKVLMILPPQNGTEDLIVQARRQAYVDALVTFLATFKDLKKVFIPSPMTLLHTLPLFRNGSEDSEWIEIVDIARSHRVKIRTI